MLKVTRKQLELWLHEPEGERLEFKEARGSYSFAKLGLFCAALANEGGGHLILGVTDKRPRKIVGSNAFPNLEKIKPDLLAELHLRIEAESFDHPDGRVVVFWAPSRPLGLPVRFKRIPWMRSGDGTVPMTDDRLKEIYSETGPDYSAEICSDATMEDLHPTAIDSFRSLWQKRSNNELLTQKPALQLLEDAELVVGGKVTYAALILLGTHAALGRRLPQAEVIFEYRSEEGNIDYQDRKEYREGYLLFHDSLWEKVNLRNDLFFFQEGPVRQPLRTFNEIAVREALLNAVSHRDYRLGGSVFVKQWPKRIEIISPGGLPNGITVKNILLQQAPRNRRIAEALARCGLVERSGQGIDRIYEACISEGKLPPDFTGSDEHRVTINLNGRVQDPQFLQFIRDVVIKLTEVTTKGLVVLDAVHRELPVPEELHTRLEQLLDLGLLGSEGGTVTLRRYLDKLPPRSGRRKNHAPNRRERRNPCPERFSGRGSHARRRGRRCRGGRRRR
ncbi:MAG: transcriptional regulator [bacterium]|nr:transcriptional regulator [bacterium]